MSFLLNGNICVNSEIPSSPSPFSLSEFPKGSEIFSENNNNNNNNIDYYPEIELLMEKFGNNNNNENNNINKEEYQQKFQNFLRQQQLQFQQFVEYQKLQFQNFLIENQQQQQPTLINNNNNISNNNNNNNNNNNSNGIHLIKNCSFLKLDSGNEQKIQAIFPFKIDHENKDKISMEYKKGNVSIPISNLEVRLMGGNSCEACIIFKHCGKMDFNRKQEDLNNWRFDIFFSGIKYCETNKFDLFTDIDEILRESCYKRTIEYFERNIGGKGNTLTKLKYQYKNSDFIFQNLSSWLTIDEIQKKDTICMMEKMIDDKFIAEKKNIKKRKFSEEI